MQQNRPAPRYSDGSGDAPSDEQLIRRVATGDRSAFTALARRHMKALYAAAFRLCNDRATAEDAVQEALLRLWTKAGAWDREKGASVKTWLYRIACNACIDLLRKKRPETELKDWDEPMDGMAEKDMERKETGVLVGALIQELPERQRMALVLCHYEELSNADAASVMGTTIKGVEALLARARKALGIKLERYHGSI